MCSAVSLEPRHRLQMSPDNPNDAVIHNTHHYDEDDTSCDLVYKQTNGIDSIIVDTSAKGTQGNSTTSTTPFFEGVEKNLEVWFTNSPSQTVDGDLRNIPRFATFPPINFNHQQKLHKNRRFSFVYFAFEMMHLFLALFLLSPSTAS